MKVFYSRSKFELEQTRRWSYDDGESNVYILERCNTAIVNGKRGGGGGRGGGRGEGGRERKKRGRVGRKEREGVSKRQHEKQTGMRASCMPASVTLHLTPCTSHPTNYTLQPTH